LDTKNKRKPIYVGSASDLDPIEKLAPGASKEVKHLLLQFKDRNAEIESWFQEDPKRLTLLQKDPEKVLNELLNALKLERPGPAKRPDLGQWDIIIKPKPTPVGSSLLLAVWQHISRNPQNTQDFITDPFNVIHVVASNIKATKEEIGAVIQALETIRGIYHIEVNPLGTLAVISGSLPSSSLALRRVS
jgi:hypothetical protein